MSRGAATAYMHSHSVRCVAVGTFQPTYLACQQRVSLLSVCGSQPRRALHAWGCGSRSSLYTAPVRVYSSSRHPQKDSRATTYTHTQGGPAAGRRCSAQPHMCMCDAAPARGGRGRGGRRARSTHIAHAARAQPAQPQSALCLMWRIPPPWRTHFHRLLSGFISSR